MNKNFKFLRCDNFKFSEAFDLLYLNGCEEVYNFNYLDNSTLIRYGYYIDGVYIKNPTLYPLKSVDYNTYKDVYRNTFGVKSSGTLDQNIQIDLNISKNEFSNNSLKYIVYNERGYEMASGYVPKTGKVTLANNMYLASNDTARYTLIIWLDNTNYNQNFEMGSTITGSITVYATQIKY